jgi:multiple sugar transport system permease protein
MPPKARYMLPNGGYSAAMTDRLHMVAPGVLPPSRVRGGRALAWAAGAVLVGTFALQAAHVSGHAAIGFADWRPVLYAYLFWGVSLGIAQVMIHGEQGKRALFVLPAALFTVAMVIFPLAFGLFIALSDWNLSSAAGRRFNGLANFWRLLDDPFYRNAMKNMAYYVAAILVEYWIAFGLALLLNAEIRARRFWRVVFLLPLMLSPVAVSWMIGKSMLEVRFGPVAGLARELGWDTPTFFAHPEIARAAIMVMDAWTYIPFMMIMLLAGLQSLPREVQEAARVDGANAWQGFWAVTFPLMLPVSVTVIIIRVIFKLKLADIIITVTAGGPGGATDSVTSFIFREYRDRSNVGYGTMLAMVYLILIVIFVTALLKFLNRWLNRPD